MSYTILYAEDEPFLARIVSDNLSDKGYKVLIAENGNAALQLFKEFKPDLCLLDIMMPLKDGYTLTEDIRKLDPSIPVIFLSAKSLAEDVVKGFKSGGNDYLKKPFSVAELLVRVEALLTRFGNGSLSATTQKQTMYEFAGCRLDTVNQRLETPKARHDLSYKEMELLKMLLQHKNEVLERQDALKKIWGNDSHYNANSMNVFMAHLRKLLKDDSRVQIISVRGIGYKLVS